MLLKVKTSNGWVMFDEIDYLEHWDITREDVLGETPNELKFGLDFTEGFSTKMENQIVKGIRFMNKNQIDGTFIRAYSPVYLLNNEGKTIEKL